MSTSLRVTSPWEGHIDVETLAGSATLSLHRHGLTPWGPVCIPVTSTMLDPAQVLELATELTQASVPPPPPASTVVRRLRVFRSPVELTWRFECPEHLPSRAWHQHADALAEALDHLETEHAASGTRSSS